ncbi:MAG: HPr family phosphocarrier protein [Planctomycetota bacterium]|nr:HPr family phosphocarrier protein [Planctomycetota bacterium]
MVGEQHFGVSLSAVSSEFQSSLQRILDLGTAAWSEGALYALYQQATSVETFLDDHGAKRNAAFHGVREATSRLRWLCLAASAFAHLQARLPTYLAPDPAALQEDLGKHVIGLISRIATLIERASQSLVEQWLTAGAQWSPQVSVEEEDRVPRQSLPADRPLLEEESEEGASRAARFVGRFVRLCGAWAPDARIPRRGIEELQAYMKRFCSEPMARVIESRAHNLQSEFDTHVRGTPEAEEYPGLMALRSGVSQAFHLLEAITALTHLFERHWLHEKERAYRESFEDLMPLPEFLDLIVNGCIVRAHRCLAELLPEAEAILERVAKPQERRILLPVGLTLHARPLSLIVAVVNHHKTPVEMRLGDGSANAASIMSLLILAGSQIEAREVVFKGAENVLEDLQLLIDSGLGEDGMDAIPDRVRNYLRS